jgi:hypothetical protein
MEELKAKTRELNELLAPYAIALTPQERHDLPKMGEKTVSFVEKSFELAVENSDLRPPFAVITPSVGYSTSFVPSWWHRIYKVPGRWQFCFSF